MARDPLASLDLNLLLVLDAMLREKSVTSAARALGTSQSALSHALGRLRHALGDPLFSVVDRRMLATPYAARIGPAVAAALRTVRGALSPDGFDPLASEESFSFSAPDVVLAIGLARLIESLRVLMPKGRLVLADYDPGNLRTALSAGRVDVALVPTHTPPAGLCSSVLIREAYIVIARRNHPRFARRLTLEQYLDLEHVIVATHDGVPSDIDVSLAGRGLSRKIALRSPAFSVVPQLVAETDLVSTTVPSIVRVSGFAGRLRRAALPFSVGPGMGLMVWHERAQSDPAQRWFRSQVERAYGSGIDAAS